MNSRITSPTVCSFVSDDFLDNIRQIRELGRGTYGNVYLIETQDGSQYAVKYMNIDSEDPHIGVSQSILLDIDSLIRLRNVRDVINVIGICYQTNPSNSSRIALILEAMDSNLRSFIDKTSLKDRLRLTPHLLEVMVRVAALMETLNIIHFDIKPQNVLVRGRDIQAQFKITDFGLAKAYIGSNDISTDEVFTRWYRPPEFLAVRNRSTFKIFAGDIWAIAITVLEFITGRPIFPGRDVANMLRLIYEAADTPDTSLLKFNTAIHNGTITGQLSAMNLIRIHISQYEAEQLNPQIINMLSRMLSLNANDRPTGIQLLDEFNERINPEFLSTLLPPPYPRRIHSGTIDLILRVGKNLNLSKATMLIALEIFTRYLDILAIDLNEDINLHVRALAAIRIAAVYSYIGTIETYQIKDAYQMVCGMMCSPIRNVQIAEMEKDVLHNINFQIYNLNLSPVIERAYAKNIDLGAVNPNQFAESLESWLIE
jgi:serine/threonine protein kinase